MVRLDECPLGKVVELKITENQSGTHDLYMVIEGTLEFDPQIVDELEIGFENTANGKPVLLQITKEDMEIKQKTIIVRKTIESDKVDIM